MRDRIRVYGEIYRHFHRRAVLLFMQYFVEWGMKNIQPHGKSQQCDQQQESAQDNRPDHTGTPKFGHTFDS